MVDFDCGYVVELTGYFGDLFFRFAVLNLNRSVELDELERLLDQLHTHTLKNPVCSMENAI